jgi:hypothetical protein
MTPHVQTGSDPGLASLATGILHDGQELLKQQFLLFRHEIEAKARQTAEASACMVVGLLLALIGAGLLALTLVFVLVEVAHLPHWAAFLVIGVCFSVIGGAVTFVGVTQFQKLTPVPEQTAETLKENLEWTTNQR